MARFWVSLKRRGWYFAAAVLLVLLGFVGVWVHPQLVADGAPSWLLWLPRIALLGPLLGILLALVMVGGAALDAFGEPRRPQPR